MTGKWVVFLELAVVAYTESFSQCVPQFPVQQGWLGGDNAISVQLGNNRVAWFFSDSFVGRPLDITRESAQYVANSVAISKCDSGEFKVRYFWKHGGTDHAGAFFRDPESKFKYWPAHAFVHDGNLFVVLSVIGPKPNPQKNDLFNFKHYGVMLASVSNFEAEPDQWGISYASWDSVIPHEWTGAAVSGNHLYILRSSPLREVALVRLNLENLAVPDPKIEYWSKDKVWKDGFDGSDASILFREYVNGSLNYNSNLKKWVLVYGPSFLSNAIHYRVADTIIGTWSDPIQLYKIPEVTPGNKQFDPAYFCYCGREQAIFSRGNEICVTYDCNSSNFSKLTHDMGIYFPRVRYLSIQ